MQSDFFTHRSSRSWRPGAIFVFSLSLALFLSTPAPASAAPSGKVTHVVFFWMKRPGNKEDETRLTRASESFRTMPGVLRVQVGRSLPVRRVGREQAFDLCALFTFQNQTALERFEKDPRHQHAVVSVLRPLVRRSTVFNVVADE